MEIKDNEAKIEANTGGYTYESEATKDRITSDMEKIKRGNGLNNLEKRAKEIDGQITIKSEPGKGTCINMMVILKKSLLTEK